MAHHTIYIYYTYYTIYILYKAFGRYSFLLILITLKLYTLKTYTLHYTCFDGGGDTGEPETSTEKTLKDLTKEKLNSWLYTLKEGDFGCSFGNFRIEEH